MSGKASVKRTGPAKFFTYKKKLNQVSCQSMNGKASVNCKRRTVNVTGFITQDKTSNICHFFSFSPTSHRDPRECSIILIEVRVPFKESWKISYKSLSFGHNSVNASLYPTWAKTIYSNSLRSIVLSILLREAEHTYAQLAQTPRIVRGQTYHALLWYKRRDWVL